MNPKAVVSCLASLLLSLSGFAHDTWLIPDQFHVAPRTTVTLELTSGMEFPKLDVAPKPERVKVGQCRLAGKTVDVADISPGPNSLRFKCPLAETGVATCWVKLPARELELKPDQVQEYFDEIQPPEAVRKQWAEAKEPKRFRESYTKHPKTFVRVGEAPGDRSWAEPVGMALEIVPGKDPTTLRAGDELPVRVLKNGAPLADFPLSAVSAGATRGETKKTDAEGRVTFQCNNAGPWLLRGTDLRKSSKENLDWESDFTTLTLEVAAK